MQSKNIILVVDDEQFIGRILERTLEDEYRVITANNGLEAMDKVDRERPDLIILDVKMPEMSGIEVCQKLKRGDRSSEFQHIPIIMLTHKQKIGDVETGIATGADLYVTKPFNLARLRNKIKTLLN